MTSITFKIDKKGRLQIPSQIRKRLRLEERARGRVEGGRLVVEPSPQLLDELSGLIKFRFQSVEEALPKLRRAAQKQLLQEVRWR